MSRFVTLPNGEKRWGPHGAAGLLLVDRTRPAAAYLLAYRSGRTHMGDVWGLPGGAIEAGESPLEAAVREAGEELGGLPTFALLGDHVQEHGVWSYTTLVGEIDAAAAPWQPPALNWELDRTAWVEEPAVTGLKLHPGLALAWPWLRDVVRASRARSV